MERRQQGNGAQDTTRAQKRLRLVAAAASDSALGPGARWPDQYEKKVKTGMCLPVRLCSSVARFSTGATHAGGRRSHTLVPFTAQKHTRQGLAHEQKHKGEKRGTLFFFLWWDGSLCRSQAKTKRERERHKVPDRAVSARLQVFLIFFRYYLGRGRRLLFFFVPLARAASKEHLCCLLG